MGQEEAAQHPPSTTDGKHWLELEARHGSAGSTGPQLNSRLNCGLREGWTFGLGPFFPTIKWSQQVSEALSCIKPKAAGVVTYLIHDLRAQSGVRDTHFQGNGNSGAQDTESFVRN